jgi:hypothetical protein
MYSYQLMGGGMGGGGVGNGMGLWMSKSNWQLAEYSAGKTQKGPNTYDRLDTKIMSLFFTELCAENCCS